jgi:Virulence factor membrane-bound polymerase, C-terminal/O-Antigen ligase/Protein glycosylation ligase
LSFLRGSILQATLKAHPLGFADVPTGIGWVLLPLALALPWLLATHTNPWTMFHAEWLIAGAMLCLAVWAVAVLPGRWALTWSVLALGPPVLLPLAHAAGGRLVYAADGWLAGLYLGALFLAAATGMRAEALQPHRGADAIFSSLVIASVASTGLMLYQWLGFNDLGMLVMTLPVGGRLVANVGQPNLLATLLVWGVLGVWWGVQRKRIGPAVATLAAAFLLLGVAGTQSRTGMLEVAVLAFVAVLGRRGLGQPRRGVVLLLLAWFAIAVLAWPTLTAALEADTALSLEQQASLSRRPLIWQLALQLIAEMPLLGWGWNQTLVGQVALFTKVDPLHLVLPYMHNLVLDLMIWCGVPLGMLAAGALLAWFVSRWRRHVPAQRPLLLALTVLLLHSMLELPHAYALFLLPAGLLFGALEQQFARRNPVAVPRAVPATMVAVLALALAVMAVDYLRVESDLQETRIRAARIGDLTPVAPPRPLLLVPLGDLLTFMRLEPARGMDAAVLADMNRVATRFPSGPNLFLYAQASALNRRPDEARRALALLCHLMLPAQCQAAGDAWREIGKERFPEMLLVTPPSP